MIDTIIGIILVAIFIISMRHFIGLLIDFLYDAIADMKHSYEEYKNIDHTG